MKKQLIITKELLKALEQSSYSLDKYIVLHSVINDYFDNLVKIKFVKTEHINELLDRKLFDLKSKKLTDKGLNFFNTIKPKVQTIQFVNDISETYLKEIEESFNLFWNNFPTSDKWGVFSKTRVLRSDKKRAFKYYKKILLDPEDCSHKDLIRALDKDIALKKKTSTIENKLKYMPAICTWLNKRYFEGFLEDEQVVTSNLINRKVYGEDVS